MKRSRARTSDPHEHRIPLKVRSQRERGVVYGETTRFSFAHRRSGHIARARRGRSAVGSGENLAFTPGLVRPDQNRESPGAAAATRVPENTPRKARTGLLGVGFCPP